METMQSIEILEVEGAELMASFDVTDDMAWRKRVLKFHAMKRELERKMAYAEKVKKLFGEAIKEGQKALDGFETFLMESLKLSPFKTKEGGYKLDLIDAGSVGLSKERVSFEVAGEDEDYWMLQGFKRMVPEKEVIDKAKLNEHLKQFEVRRGHVVNPQTGEVIEHVKAVLTPVFTIKEAKLR